MNVIIAVLLLCYQHKAVAETVTLTLTIRKLFIDPGIVDFYKDQPERLKDLYEFKSIQRDPKTYNSLTALPVDELTYFTSIFGAHRHLILIDNFYGVDIPKEIEHPIILRQLIPGVITYLRSSREEHLLSWLPLRSHTNNSNRTRKTPQPCRLSYGFHWICYFEIEFVPFTMKTRPWQQNAQISISFPKMGENHYLKAPSIFRISEELYSIENILPSTVSWQIVLVSNTANLSSVETRRWFEGYENLVEGSGKPLRWSHNVFLISKLFHNRSERYIYCEECRPIPFKQWCDIFPTENNVIMFSALQSVILKIFNKKDYREFIRQTISCKNRFSESLFLSQNSIDENIALAHANVLMKILSNYTYDVHDDRACSNGVVINNYPSGDLIALQRLKLQVSKYSGDFPQRFQHSIMDHFNSLGIIGCGQAKSNGLAFNELVNVFDSSIWFWIIASTICLIKVLKLLNAHPINSVSCHVGTILRAYISQDLTERVSRRVSITRIVLCLFYCAVIVLNNAWKNDNVYNMVLPRKTVHPETLSNYIKDQYTIYTRFFSWFNYATTEPDDVGSFDNHRIYSGTGDLGSYALFSEVRHRILGPFDDENNKKIHETLYNVSSLHPTLMKLLPEAVNAAKEIIQGGGVREDWLSNDIFFRIFFNMQEKLLWEDLKSCKRSALVLPMHMLSNYSFLLHRSNISSGYVHLGKETFCKLYSVLELEGNVPVWLSLRCKKIIETGVMDWWQKYISEVGPGQRPYYEHSELKKPRMTGNILVIFVLWLCGLGMSISAFSIETRKFVLKFLMKLWIIFKNSTFSRLGIYILSKNYKGYKLPGARSLSSCPLTPCPTDKNLSLFQLKKWLEKLFGVFIWKKYAFRRKNKMHGMTTFQAEYPP